MTFHAISVLYIIDLAAYVLITPIALYLGFRHGQEGLLGFFYLVVACTLRGISDIIMVLPSTQNNPYPTITTTVISSIGLSPLILAFSGLLHETHVYLITRTTRIPQKLKNKKTWLWVLQLQIHTVAVLGLVLIIIGSIKLIDAEETVVTNDQSHSTIDTSSYDKLRTAGAIILLVTWVFLAQYSIYLTFMTHKNSMDDKLRRLATWTLPAAAFIGIRTIYPAAYVFDHKDSKLNPLTGATWVKVIFIVLMPLMAITSMVIGAWQSRAIKDVRKDSLSDVDTGFEAIRTKH